jgi:hypothetical protein
VNLGNFDPQLIAAAQLRRFDGAETWKLLDELGGLWPGTEGGERRLFGRLISRSENQ